jgi:tRNA pseudouridine55 synthase
MIHRVLRVDKSSGPTSHDVVDRVRRLLGQRRVGHAGTLDPLATGLLLVCAGRATKIAPLLSDLDKEYRARVHLGVATDTGDAEGKVIAQAPVAPETEARLREALPHFIGAVEQVPPMASAIKVKGERLHRLRRAGMVVARPPRTVRVHALEILAVEPPFVDLRVACSKGTYIRSLAADLALAAGSCGHLAGLRRVRVGPFVLEDAVSSDGLAGADRDQVLARSGMSLSAALAHLPAVTVDDDAAYAVRHGIIPRRQELRSVSAPLQSGDLGRLESPEGELVAVVIATGSLGGADADAAEPVHPNLAEAPAPLRFRRVLIGRSESP